MLVKTPKTELKLPDLTKPVAEWAAASAKLYKAIIDYGLADEGEIKAAIHKIDRRRVVRALRDKGLSLRLIGEAVGASYETVRRDLGVTDVTDAVTNVTAMSTRELLSQSDQNDWRTPRKYLDAARKVMGGTIDLDPASSAEANETVGAKRFFIEKENGLEQPWKGTVWLNPPYGGEARLFVERLVREYQVGNVTAACALVNSHPTETKWFQELFDYAVCFIRGRIDFGGPSREVSSTSTHGSAIAYLGNKLDDFHAEFSQFGAVMVRWSAAP